MSALPLNGDCHVAFPAVTKILSRDIAHKSEVGGVLACEMIPHGVEMLVGVVNDPCFGPVVALGLGGVFAEVLNDVTHRVAPFGIPAAQEMIAQLKGRAILEGARGRRAMWPH